MLNDVYMKFRQAVSPHKKLAVQGGNKQVNRLLSKDKKC